MESVARAECTSHILTKKATKRKRNLRQTNHVRPEDAGRLQRMLPYL
jgi:large subunit ribosomal protein L35